MKWFPLSSSFWPEWEWAWRILPSSWQQVDWWHHCPRLCHKVFLMPSKFRHLAGHLDQGLVAFSFLLCTLSKGFLLPTWGLAEWIRLASPSPSACRTLLQQRDLSLIRSPSGFCPPGWTSVTSFLWHIYLIPEGSVPQCKCFILIKLLFRKLILTKHAACWQWVWFQIVKVMW